MRVAGLDVTMGSPVSTEPTGQTDRVENGLALTIGSTNETISAAATMIISFRILVLSFKKRK